METVQCSNRQMSSKCSSIIVCSLMWYSRSYNNTHPTITDSPLVKSINFNYYIWHLIVQTNGNVNHKPLQTVYFLNYLSRYYKVFLYLAKCPVHTCSFKLLWHIRAQMIWFVVLDGMLSSQTQRGLFHSARTILHIWAIAVGVTTILISLRLQ